MRLEEEPTRQPAEHARAVRDDDVTRAKEDDADPREELVESVLDDAADLDQVEVQRQQLQHLQQRLLFHRPRLSHRPMWGATKR